MSAPFSSQSQEKDMPAVKRKVADKYSAEDEAEIDTIGKLLYRDCPDETVLFRGLDQTLNKLYLEASSEKHGTSRFGLDKPEEPTQNLFVYTDLHNELDFEESKSSVVWFKPG